MRLPVAQHVGTPAPDREVAQRKWIEEARPGLKEEARHLEVSGPTLARWRRVPLDHEGQA